MPDQNGFLEFSMNTKSCAIRRSLLVMGAGVVLLASGEICLSQNIDFLAQQGNDVQQLRELVERLQLALENSEQRTTRDVEVAVFAVGEAAQEGPEGPHHQGSPRTGISFTGPSGFSARGLQMRGRAEMHPGEGPQIHHPEANSPAGPFAEDRKRIAALTESAERITQAGLPDVAHGLRERAGQLERELAEKQERMQQEERKRMESELREQRGQIRPQTQHLMEHRREGIEIELVGHPTPALRELHEQMEQLRHDMHKLSEQMADLTRLSSKRHNPKNDADDEDADDEDGDDDDRKERGEQKEE